jgi:hypothetical protein
MTLGTPLARLPVAGGHVPVDRRQRIGASASAPALFLLRCSAARTV